MSAVDVVLVNPPSSPEQEFGLLAGGGASRPPLNLLNLGASLEEAGYSVRVVDGAGTEGGVDAVASEVVAARPRYVGVTAMTAHVRTAGRLAEELHRRLPGVPLVLGGAHVSTLPEETLHVCRAFDVGVVGEGDRTIVEVVAAFDAGKELTEVAGLVLRRDGEVVRTRARSLEKNLDALPLPAWHLLPDYAMTYQPTLSRRERLPSAYIVTSRGCPFPCTFCSNSVHGRRFRSYSVGRLMEMVDHMVRAYRVRDLTIYDENLALDRQRVVGVCERLIAAGYDLTWSCDARADCIDDELLDLMYRAGCRSIWFGIESGSQEILARYKKRLSLEQIAAAVRSTRAHKIKATGSFIIGGPGESPRTIRETVRFAKRLRLDYFVPFFYTPLPGAPAYATIAEEGTVDLAYEAATMTRPIFAPHGMTLRGVYFWYVRSLVSFYSSPRALLGLLRDVGVGKVVALGLAAVGRAASAIARLGRGRGGPGDQRDSVS